MYVIPLTFCSPKGGAVRVNGGFHGTTGHRLKAVVESREQNYGLNPRSQNQIGSSESKHAWISNFARTFDDHLTSPIKKTAPKNQNPMVTDTWELPSQPPLSLVYDDHQQPSCQGTRSSTISTVFSCLLHNIYLIYYGRAIHGFRSKRGTVRNQRREATWQSLFHFCAARIVKDSILIPTI